ncbi:hypothetical protein L7F22_054441 [Adiantum nelumboides]|nr:hypothetical protein [Adiantum nelumboides]
MACPLSTLLSPVCSTGNGSRHALLCFSPSSFTSSQRRYHFDLFRSNNGSSRCSFHGRGVLAVQASLGDFDSHIEATSELISTGLPQLLERAEGLLYTIADAAVSTDTSVADTVQKTNRDWLSGLTDGLEAILKVLKDGLQALHVPYSYGFAIILLTVLVKAATFPLSKQQVESSMSMQNLSPKIKAIQQQYAGNQIWQPLEIISRPGFRKGLLTEVCEELHILHRHSAPYYPQSNDGALWAYRTTYSEAAEFTLFHLVYGQEALQPIELNISTMRLHGKAAQGEEESWMDRLLILVELEWKREAAYECYKRKATQVKDKLDKEVKDKGIKEEDLVLRYDNRLDNRFDERIQLETARLYKQAGVNPLAGCLPTLATIPVWIGLYRALSNVANEGLLTEGFFWIPSLAGPTTIAARQSGSGISWLFPFVDGAPPLGWSDTIAYLVLPVLLIASQYVSMQLMQTPQSVDPSQKNTQAILKFLPLMIGYFALSVPSGLSLYWQSTRFFAVL